MHRRAYALLIGVASVMGILALTASISLGRPLVDPEGFLGPAWLRLPLLLLGAFLLDIVPRMLWVSGLRPKEMPGVVKARIDEHWDRERITLVVFGLVCFYVTYVSYRNLKSFLPFIMGEDKYDHEDHAKRAAREVTPVAAVGPRWNDAHKKKDEDDEKDCTNAHDGLQS